MRLIDTNVMLRYMLGPEQPNYAEAYEAILEGAKTIPEAVAEAVYVLMKVYGLPRVEISASLLNLLEDVEVDHPGVIRHSLEIFGETNFDYVDCLFLSHRDILGEEFLTFDRKLEAAKKKTARST